MATSQQPEEQGTGMKLAEQGKHPVAHVETASAAVASRARAAVEARFLVARGAPRNYDLARQRLMLRCESPLFAEVAEYSKPIGGKSVTGASIRLMEEIGRWWGNLDVQSNITFDDNSRRIINVSATDLETNYTQSQDIILSKTVERRFPKKGEVVLGQRENSKGETVFLIEADEEQFIVKQNANISKTRREMIRAVVPGDLVEEALDVTRKTRRNRDAKDPAGARKAIADSFFRMGVMANQLTDFLGKPNLEAITDAELERLRQIYTAIKEGETTWAETVADAQPAADRDTSTPQTGKGTSGLKEKLQRNGGKKEDAKDGGNGSPLPVIEVNADVDALIKKHGSATKAMKEVDIRSLPKRTFEVLSERAEAERTD